MLLKLQQIPISILENRACPLAIKVYKMAREVSKDCERAKQFTRTQINDHGLLYGTVMLKHHTCDLVLNFFHNRYPLFTVALYNHLKKETYIIDPAGIMSIEPYDLSLILSKFNQSHPISPFFAKLATQPENKALFSEFYSSQFISERENRRYFGHMIPKEVRQWPGMEIEKGFGNQKLDKFFKPKNGKDFK